MLRQGSNHVSIHAPSGANLEEVTPLPNELYPPEGGGFKPKRVFDQIKPGWRAILKPILKLKHLLD